MKLLDDIRKRAEQIIERRKFIRHPFDIPIQISPEHLEGGENTLMSDVSGGGLAIQTGVFYKEGTRLNVCIPHVPAPFEAIGEVCWHRSINDQYEMGIRFLDEASTLWMRMVEQICQIEQCRKQLMAEGNLISFEDAAREWIDKYAEDFWRNRS
jgi:hypothetical protein